MRYIFRWDGNFLCFLRDNLLFDPNGIYLGWVENNEIYDRNGIYKGEIYQDDYAIRNAHKNYMNKAPRIPPMNIIPSLSPVNRVGYVSVMGYEEIVW